MVSRAWTGGREKAVSYQATHRAAAPPAESPPPLPFLVKCRLFDTTLFKRFKDEFSKPQFEIHLHIVYCSGLCESASLRCTDTETSSSAESNPNS